MQATQRSTNGNRLTKSDMVRFTTKRKFCSPDLKYIHILHDRRHLDWFSALLRMQSPRGELFKFDTHAHYIDPNNPGHA